MEQGRNHERDETHEEGEHPHFNKCGYVDRFRFVFLCTSAALREIVFLPISALRTSNGWIAASHPLLAMTGKASEN